MCCWPFTRNVIEGDRTPRRIDGRHEPVSSLLSGGVDPRSLKNGAGCLVAANAPLLFQGMSPVELKSELQSALDAVLVHPRVLLNTSRLINESDRRAAAYTDPKFIPFYYHLGKILKPKAVLEIGFRLGLTAAALNRGCQTVEHYLAVQETSDQFYSARLAKANVRDHFRGHLYTHAGSVDDDGFSALSFVREWDLVIVNDEVGYDRHLLFLETVWPLIPLGGWLVCDYVESHKPAKKAIEGFCKARNLHPEFVGTRYGVALVQK